jgi:hypothetical protein
MSTHCCSQAMACDLNPECLKIQQCVLGSGGSNLGCRQTDGGVDLTCALTCYNAHSAGQADFNALWYTATAQKGCAPTNCATECKLP